MQNSKCKVQNCRAELKRIVTADCADYADWCRVGIRVIAGMGGRGYDGGAVRGCVAGRLPACRRFVIV